MSGAGNSPRRRPGWPAIWGEEPFRAVSPLLHTERTMRAKVEDGAEVSRRARWRRWRLLNLFCAWYYNPTAYEWDAARATDTIRTPGAWTSRATEGCRLDAHGRQRLQQRRRARRGRRVGADDGLLARRGAQRHAGPERRRAARARCSPRTAQRGMVYNIGVSSHTLPRCAANLRPRAGALPARRTASCWRRRTSSFPLASLAAAHGGCLRAPAARRTSRCRTGSRASRSPARCTGRALSLLRRARPRRRTRAVPFELTDENL